MPLTLEQARAELSKPEARAAVLERIGALQSPQAPPYGAAYSGTSSKGSDDRSVSSNGGTPTYVLRPASPTKENAVRAAENVQTSVHGMGRAAIRTMPHPLEAAVGAGKSAIVNTSGLSSEAQNLEETPRSATIRYTSEQLLEARRIHDEVTRGGGKNPEYQKKLNRHIVSKPTVTKVTKPSPKPSHPSPARRYVFRSSADVVKTAASGSQADKAITPSAKVASSSTVASTPGIVQEASASRIVQESRASLQAPRTPLLKAVSSDLPPTPPSVSQHIVRAMSNLTINDMISGGAMPHTHGKSGAVFAEKTNEAYGQAVQDRNKVVISSAKAEKETTSNGCSTTTVTHVNGSGEKRQDGAITIPAQTEGFVKAQELTLANKLIEQLCTSVRSQQVEITSLRHRIIDLERDHETQKFVGTRSGKTPFMVEVSYPDGDARRIQTFGEMRVNRLLERVVREKGIQNSLDSASLKHGAEELGHLAMIGEYDLGEGHRLDFTYN